MQSTLSNLFMKKSLINFLPAFTVFSLFSVWFAISAKADESAMQTNVANAVNLVMRSGNDQQSISYALDWLAPYPKQAVLEKMVSDCLQVPQPPTRRRQETAIRLIVMSSGTDYLAPVLSDLHQQNDPARIIILMHLLSDLKFSGIDGLLRPYLSDTRSVGELIGEERASGTAMRVCDEAYNAIQKCRPQESRRPILRADSTTSARASEIQQLKASIPQQ